MRIDGDGEGRAQLAVLWSTWGCSCSLSHRSRGQGQADHAAGVLDHEVDRLGRDLLGRDDEVALVLAVFIIDQDDHLAGLEVFEDFGNGRKRHRSRLLQDEPRALSRWQRRRQRAKQVLEFRDLPGRGPLDHALTPHQAVTRQAT